MTSLSCSLFYAFYPSNLGGFSNPKSAKSFSENTFSMYWEQGCVLSFFFPLSSCLFTYLTLNGCLIPFSSFKLMFILIVKQIVLCVSVLGYKVVFKVLIHNAISNYTTCHLNVKIQCKTCRSAYGSIMNSKWIYFDPWWMFQWITNEFAVIGHRKC